MLCFQCLAGTRLVVWLYGHVLDSSLCLCLMFSQHFGHGQFEHTCIVAHVKRLGRVDMCLFTSHMYNGSLAVYAYVALQNAHHSVHIVHVMANTYLYMYTCICIINFSWIIDHMHAYWIRSSYFLLLKSLEYTRWHIPVCVHVCTYVCIHVWGMIGRGTCTVKLHCSVCSLSNDDLVIEWSSVMLSCWI